MRMLKTCRWCDQEIEGHNYWYHTGTHAIRCHFDRDDLPNTDSKIAFLHYAEPRES